MCVECSGLQGGLAWSGEELEEEHAGWGSRRAQGRMKHFEKEMKEAGWDWRLSTGVEQAEPRFGGMALSLRTRRTGENLGTCSQDITGVWEGGPETVSALLVELRMSCLALSVIATGTCVALELGCRAAA